MRKLRAVGLKRTHRLRALCLLGNLVLNPLIALAAAPGFVLVAVYLGIGDPLVKLT
jgi:hypothetical protein